MESGLNKLAVFRNQHFKDVPKVQKGFCFEESTKMTTHFSRALIVKMLLGSLIIGGSVYAYAKATQHKKHVNAAKTAVAKPIRIKIDLDKSMALTLPEVKAELKPASFKTSDGKEGWVVRIPGNLPIATPAYSDGKIYVGGGYGSHEFYAFDSRTGEKVWQIKTSDDGPSAAVVEDGCVAFNTESCTVIVADAKTGDLLWQKWLGDPLMSQPAISKGRLYMAYPAGGRGQGNMNNAPGTQIQSNNSTQHQVDQTSGIAAGSGQPANGTLSPPAAQTHTTTGVPPASTGLSSHASPSSAGQSTKNTGTHRLLCANLRTGKPYWTQVISADVISAPVIEGDQVFLTCFDGTSYCLNATTGDIVWKKENSGTSAPIIADGKVMMTLKQQRGSKDYEGIQRYEAKGGRESGAKPFEASKAEYFKNGNSVALEAKEQATLDSAVGFGGGAPASAGMAHGSSNLGVNTVAGGWAYQGSRATYRKGQIMNAQGNALNSYSDKESRLTWKAEASGRNISADSQVFSPPALGSKNMYLCTAQGHLLSVDQKSGAVQFQYATSQPMPFQPALARGNLYVGTSNGLLICLKTGQKDADGWTAWGGNAQHNKKD